MNGYTTILYGDREWMLFVDGENLTRRGQETLKSANVALKAGDRWRKDVYLWLPDYEAGHAFFSHHGHKFRNEEFQGPRVRSAIRAYYYTSTTSDEPEWTGTRLALRSMGFEPRLFKRAGGRSKAVDVALTTEVLTLASEQRYEAAIILAGDGDYVPLVEAVKRIGLHVAVGFFEQNGLSPELRIAADQFFDLTPHFIQAWKAHHLRLERGAAIAEAAEGSGEEPPG